MKLVDKFTSLGSSVSSTENSINTQLAKEWTAINKLSVVWRSDLSDKISSHVHTIIWMHYIGAEKRIQKKLDGNCTRMLRTVLNKICKQYPTKLQLYGHLPLICKTIQIRRTWHAGHSWSSKDEFISDVFLCTRSRERASVGRPTRNYLQQLSADTGCNLEDLTEVMDNRDKGWGRVREIRVRGLTEYIYNIQSASEDSGCGLFAYRIYEEYQINLCECSMYGYCYISFSFQVYITKLTNRAYIVQIEGNSNLVKLSL